MGETGRYGWKLEINYKLKIFMHTKTPENFFGVFYIRKFRSYGAQIHNCCFCYKRYAPTELFKTLF